MDTNYPYTPVDNSGMQDKNHMTPGNKQQPPPYSDYNSPALNRYAAPAAVPASGHVPVAMPTIITVNNMGGGGGMSTDTPTNLPVGPDPIIMTCPHCRCRNKTRTRRRFSLKTHIACLLLSCTG